MSAKQKVIPIANMGPPIKVRDAMQKSADILDKRASPEIVVAFMGAVGCGLPRIITECDSKLIKLGYRVIRIKLSEFIKLKIKSGDITIPSNEANIKYLANQTGGNHLRKNYGNEVLAKFAISQITRNRLVIDQEAKQLDREPPRVAYLIDQIKHPDEIMLLRMVFRNLFYMIGVMSTQENRKSRLADEGTPRGQIEDIIHRDRKESIDYGQQLEKAFKLADYFIHHPLGDASLIPAQLDRFLNLIHGSNKITPTKHEHAMYIAYSTALKSSCMSRQVGATITDKTGRIVAVGTNDVPQYGGGLYSNDSAVDDRCFNARGVCENDAQKNLRRQKIETGIATEINKIFQDTQMRNIATSKIKELADAVYAQSGIGDLIEFSRAVHAEMDALISLSRGGGGSTIGANLYSTTFPCHNCARHIVAAGIEKVYYIEPYEKSLAPDAHSDSIVVLDHDLEPVESNSIHKVKFIHFSGVGPRLYPELFLRNSRKDGQGKLVDFSLTPQTPPLKIIKEYIDSYRAFEIKISAMFDEEFPVNEDRL